MKKIFLMMTTVAMAASMLTSCKNKPEAEEALHEVTEAEYVFTKEDTLKVMDMVKQFTARLQEKDLKGAVGMLKFLDGDTIKDLSTMFQNRQGMALIPIAGRAAYTIDRVVFRSDINNEVKVDITLFEKEEGDKRPNKTSFYFRPIRDNGEWYLTVRDNITDTHSELNNVNESN